MTGTTDEDEETRELFLLREEVERLKVELRDAHDSCGELNQRCTFWRNKADVHAPPTGTAKGFDGFPKLADRPEYRLVAHVLMALMRKRRMKNGRFRVRDGIADYGVAISHGNKLDGQKR